MTTAYITHPDCRLHAMHEEHPECPERLHDIEHRLICLGVWDYLRYVEADEVSREALERVHERRYLDQIEALAPADGLANIDGDTAMNPHSLRAARLSAGAAVLGVDLVMSGEVENAFCSVRPPGHHAEPGQAMGFCFYNNIGVAAAHALERWGLERIAILDFDVHHGNGTEAMFGEDPRVLFCSSFQYPLYPGTDLQHQHETLVKSPLKMGATGEVFRLAVMEQWLPALERHRPELLLISAGFDAHVEDELAHIKLIDRDYEWVSEVLKDVAQRHAQGRMVSLLEGGYAMPALGRAAGAHIRTLMGI